MYRCVRRHRSSLQRRCTRSGKRNHDLADARRERHGNSVSRARIRVYLLLRHSAGAQAKRDKCDQQQRAEIVRDAGDAGRRLALSLRAYHAGL